MDQVLNERADRARSGRATKTSRRRRSWTSKRTRVPGLRRQGGSRGFLAPWKPRPNPLRGPLYKVSLGNCCVNAVWTPLTLDPCGAQVAATHLDHISEPERRTQVRRGTRAFSSSSLGPAVQHQGLDLLKVWVRPAGARRPRAGRWRRHHGVDGGPQRDDAVGLAEGLVSSSRCATAHPLHTRFANIFGASISEAVTRPDPK